MAVNCGNRTEHISTRCAQNLEFTNVAGSKPTYCYHCALNVKNLYSRLLQSLSMFCLPVDSVAYVSVSPHSSVVCITTAQLCFCGVDFEPYRIIIRLIYSLCHTNQLHCHIYKRVSLVNIMLKQTCTKLKYTIYLVELKSFDVICFLCSVLFRNCNF